MENKRNELLLENSLEKIKCYIAESQNQNSVVDFKTPTELSREINFQIDNDAVSEVEFLELIDLYLQNSVNTGNKQFLNQLYGGFNLPGFIGEIITTVTNTSMYTYEVAPVASRIETEMIRLMNSFAGYKNGDGIFLTGGSNANLVAMFSARNKKLPDARRHGMNHAPQLVAFISDQAHYSFETAANLLGIGADNVIKIKSDASGRMKPCVLESEIINTIEQGKAPFFVGATCATTMLGAYDPLDQLAEICNKYKIWLHADGSFGGSLILSTKHRHLLNGIEKTDSFAWNPHKLMNIPLVCSALLVKETGTLQKNITDINTDYIFHDLDNIEDLGKKSIQCGRRVDAVKLWFAWKYFGLNGYESRINTLIDLAQYAEEKIKEHPRLELMAVRQSFTVCFRIKSTAADINQYNLAIRETLRKSGKSIVNFGYIGQDLSIRLVNANAEMEFKDLDQFFQNLDLAIEEIDNTTFTNNYLTA
jgi:glutamate/tyrosine decarboxylase-like PLP-dependent enzyme